MSPLQFITRLIMLFSIIMVVVAFAVYPTITTMIIGLVIIIMVAAIAHEADKR